MGVRSLLLCSEVISRSKHVVGVLASTLLFASCTPELTKDWQPDDAQKTYRVSTRQVAPQPPYRPLTWVHLPEVLPEKRLPNHAGPVIEQVIQFELVEGSVREAAEMLANSLHYSMYCAPSIQDRKISITQLGTVREIAHEIARQGDLSVVLDHKHRELAVLARRSNVATPSPQFVVEKGQG